MVEQICNFNRYLITFKTPTFPVDTRRRFNINTTPYNIVRRRIDVETMSSVYWVIAQLILEMKLTHYLVQLWTCPGMPHRRLFEMTESICCFNVCLTTYKHSTSYLYSFVRHCNLKNPVFWLVYRFWIITQELGFSKTCNLYRN